MRRPTYPRAEDAVDHWRPMEPQPFAVHLEHGYDRRRFCPGLQVPGDKIRLHGLFDYGFEVGVDFVYYDEHGRYHDPRKIGRMLYRIGHAYDWVAFRVQGWPPEAGPLLSGPGFGLVTDRTGRLLPAYLGVPGKQIKLFGEVGT